MRGNSDGTLVIFIGGLEQFQDQKKSQHGLLSKIWAQLKHCELTMKLAAKMEIQSINGKLTIQLSTKQQSITFEMLPAFNALGEPPWVCGGGGGLGLEWLVKRAKPKKGVVDSLASE